jgi:hypothetical protein
MEPIAVSQNTIRTRPTLIKKLRWVMAIGLIGGPLVSGIGLYRYLEMNGLETKGVTIEAKVLDTNILNTGKGRRVYKVVAGYRPKGRPIYCREFIVRQEEYETAKATGKIPVTFLADKPAVSAAGSEVRPDNEPIVLGAGVFVIALFICLCFRKNK